MSLSKKAKFGVGMMILAAILIIAAIGNMMSTAEAGPTERYELDLERVAKLFVEKVKSPKDLDAFKAALNKDASEILTNDDPIKLKKKSIGVQLLEDGSILGFIDLDGDGKVLLFQKNGMAYSIPITGTAPASQSQNNDTTTQNSSQTSTDLNASAAPKTQKANAAMLKLISSPKSKEDKPTLSEEVLFFIRIQKDDKNGDQLVLTDRLYHSFKQPLEKAYRNTDIYRDTTRYQHHYYGHYWHPPMFFVYVPHGYYGSWSSARMRSLGNRSSFGGYGSGK